MVGQGKRAAVVVAVAAMVVWGAATQREAEASAMLDALEAAQMRTGVVLIGIAMAAVAGSGVRGLRRHRDLAVWLAPSVEMWLMWTDADEGDVFEMLERVHRKSVDLALGLIAAGQVLSMVVLGCVAFAAPPALVGGAEAAAAWQAWVLVGYTMPAAVLTFGVAWYTRDEVRLPATA